MLSSIGLSGFFSDSPWIRYIISVNSKRKTFPKNTCFESNIFRFPVIPSPKMGSFWDSYPSGSLRSLLSTPWDFADCPKRSCEKANRPQICHMIWYVCSMMLYNYESCLCKGLCMDEANAWKKEWRNEGMKEWRNEGMNERTNEWMNEWMNERMNEGMNEWINECSEGSKKLGSSSKSLV